MINFTFTITDLPQKGLERYTIAYVEGSLQIKINNNIFFDSEGILLVELARYIHQWLLETNNFQDFIYETMDYEEPIIKFIHLGNDLYKAESIWQKQEIKDLITKPELIECLSKYIENLRVTLKSEHGIRLEDYLEVKYSI